MSRDRPDTPLRGYTVGVTAARRADELASLLQRRGATVRHAPAIRIIPLIDDDELHAATDAVIDNPPDLVVATTGIGFRGWVEAADGWGYAEQLLTALSKSVLYARGPKAKGAIRAAGLHEEWSPASESSSEVLDRILAEGIDGKRVAVQLHGATTEWEPLPDFCDVLRAAGAEVVPVPVYRWEPPQDRAPLEQMIVGVIGAELDALAFTSAPAVASMLALARDMGLLEPFVHALRTDVVAFCVGPVTASPLRVQQVTTVEPQRYRLGALARLIAEELPRRARVLRVAGHRVTIAAQAVVVDGTAYPLSPTGRALLRVLAREPGRVVSRTDLLDHLVGGGDDTHAVESAVARLRSAIGDPKLIQTVVKRGYRLRVDVPVEEGDE